MPTFSSRATPYLSGLAVFIQCGLIFYFSNQPYDPLRAIFRINPDLGHFTGYMMLGLFVINMFHQCGRWRSGLSLFMASWIFCIAYGFSDEVHQHFVPGRHMDLNDVAVDALAAFTGILFFSLPQALSAKAVS